MFIMYMIKIMIYNKFIMTTILILSKILLSTMISTISSIYLNNIYYKPSILLIYLIVYSIYISPMLFLICPMNSLLINH